MGSKYDPAALAAAGFLYSTGASVVSDGVNGAQFCLWNTGSNGLPLTILGIEVSVTAAMDVTVNEIRKDPALGNDRFGVSLFSALNKPAGKLESAEAATPASDGVINDQQFGTTSNRELMGPGVAHLRPGTGILVSSAAVAGTVSCRFIWAEIPPAWFDDDGD